MKNAAIRLFTMLVATLGGLTLAHAHPHVWAEARMEVVIEGDTVTALRHVWRFDDIFSATVILEFDKNTDNTLDTEELEEVGRVIRESTAEFDYFQSVTKDGKTAPMMPPPVINTDLQDGRLLVFFESRTMPPMPLNGKLSFGVFDPTFYTAIDFQNDSDMVSEGLPANCKRTVIRPDPDQLIQDYADNLDQFFYDTTDTTDPSGLFATRLELNCSKAEG
ncbi:DUF1007 family protein [Notoacmeibacter sp. MSK16QG-6]|uniref:DUF1007 family protein n=1 Tax=Notoacmeibacter sp. MSK16QG-6 TaxID=2957982 RepID=UPI0020A20B5A|nr:DUF1007 family protein [Notoacmeibacter sp. MSK16QG-6]MCP1200388.1 DUF1007 family protein [Notoacmeibacter sp. MSK16QG-6]